MTPSKTDYLVAVLTAIFVEPVRALGRFLMSKSFAILCTIGTALGLFLGILILVIQNMTGLITPGDTQLARMMLFFAGICFGSLLFRFVVPVYKAVLKWIKQEAYCRASFRENRARRAREQKAIDETFDKIERGQ